MKTINIIQMALESKTNLQKLILINNIYTVFSIDYYKNNIPFYFIDIFKYIILQLKAIYIFYLMYNFI